MRAILIGVATVLLCGAALAIDANQLYYVELYPVQTSTGTTTNKAADGVDVAAYKGNAALVCAIGAGGMTTVTNTVTVQHCSTTNGTYATVTNLAGTACTFTHAGTAAPSVQTKPIDLGRLHQYVRVVAANGTDTNTVGLILVAPMKSE